MQLHLRLQGSACNGWPHVVIDANGHQLWHADVEDNPATVVVEFSSRPINIIQIRLDNKRNGPDSWDTVLDASGSIIQDKYCIIESVMLDGIRCPWLIEESTYCFDDGRREVLHGWLSQNGHYAWHVPQDIRSWVLENRRRRGKPTLQASSLDYHQNYFNITDAAQIGPLLQQCRQALDELDAGTGR